MDTKAVEQHEELHDDPFHHSVAVDFDGVLATHRNDWKPGMIGVPIKGALTFIMTLLVRGYEVHIHSARPVEEIIPWMQKHNFPVDMLTVGNHKPPCIIYIDDRGYRFDGDFDTALQAVKNLQPWWVKE